MRYRFSEIAINSTAKKKPTTSDKDTYLGLEHLDSGSLTVTRFGSDVAPIGEKLIMKKGDVLFGKRRAYQKKVAIAPFDGIFSAHGMVLRPNERVVDKGFFPLFISSDYFLDAAIKISVGSLSPTINWNTLKELEFNLPPIDRQQILAELLWSAITVRNAYTKFFTLTEQLVKSRFIEMFGTAYDLVRWPCWIIDVVADVTVGVVIKPTQYYTESHDGIRAFRSLNIGEMFVRNEDWIFFTPEGHQANRKSELREGDVLVVRSGYPGTSCVVTPEYAGCNAVDIIISRPKTEMINPVYMCAFTNFTHGKIQIAAKTGGAAQQHFNVSAYKALKIALPPLSLQRRFAEFVRQADKSKFIASRQADIVSLLYNGINGGR
jgi:type I restriction enzyme S subunit